MEIVLVWSCIISLIVIVGIPSQKVHHVIFKLLKFLGLVLWKVNLLKKIMHCVLKINIDISILLGLSKIL